MQDRLKFRYFNKHSKKMVYPDNYQNANAIYECLEQQVCFDENLPILPYDHIGNGLVFMQCTGLKDKNGKLIYEEDILKYKTTDWKYKEYFHITLVLWDRTQWQAGLLKYQRPKAQQNRRYDRKIPFKNFVSFQDYTPIKEFVNAEIIGNIYENPELLESEPTNE